MCDVQGGTIVSMLVELTVLIATLVGLLSGVWCIYWARVSHNELHARWGRRLFIVTLIGLGATAFLAALMHADGLALLGLVSGLLTVGMLVDTPKPQSESTSW
jgi:hypothetical protein